MDATDKKWIDALESMYPILGSQLPFYTSQDRGVDAYLTLTRYFQLVGLSLGPDGRILEPRDK